MVKNPFLLMAVALGVSFVVNLFAIGDFNKASIAGLITVPATLCGIVVVNRKQLTQQKRILTALEFEIHELEKWEINLNQSVSDLVAEEERTEKSINFLQDELTHLSIQTAQERSYKQQLSLDLVALNKQIHQLEAEADRWQTQIYNLEQRRGEIDVSMRSLLSEKHSTEVGLKSLQTELQQLQAQVAEQQKHKQQLMAESYNLQVHIQELERSKIQSHTAEANQNNILQAQLSLLQIQVVEQQDKLEQEAIAPVTQKRQKKQAEKLKDEWKEFVTRLPESELQVLKAIVEQDNPNAAIKKIAEDNITMPELLIEAINEHALATIGDLIVLPGSIPPAIAESEYLTNVKKVLNINEMN